MVDAVNNVMCKSGNTPQILNKNENIKVPLIFSEFGANMDKYNPLEDYNERIDNLNAKKNHIIEIISKDSAAPKSVNKEKIAQYLVDAWEETNVDFHALIAVAKQETHFNENVGIANGSGLMQITSLVVKDFYQRPGIYDKEFADLLKSEFGNSLENLFKVLDEKHKPIDELKILQAENRVPYANAGKYDEIMRKKMFDFSFVKEQKEEEGESFDELYNRIGKFGQLLYDNKNPETLMKAIRTDSAVNCRVGAYRLRRAINVSNGDIQKAFEYYNLSPGKIKYGKSALIFYNNSKEVEKAQEKLFNVKM